MATQKGRVLAATENIKEKQQKLKEEREAKRSMLDERHYVVLQQVAHSLGLEKQEVEDAMLDGNQIEQMTKFFVAHGTNRLLFYYQEPDVDSEHRSVIPGTKQVRTVKPKVFVTQGRETPLRGVCLMFIRQDPSTAVTGTNISKEVNFMQFDASVIGGNGVLKGIESLLSSVFLPSLRSLQQGWGPLDGSEGQRQRSGFLNRVESFVEVLDGARSTLENKITLKPCETYDLAKIKTPADCLYVASSTESLTLIEQQAAVWIQQIEQVLAEAEQIRKEADNVGPRAELDYWKNRATKFNHLLDQIKSAQVKAVLGVLQAAKSKSVKIWQDLDRRITDAANDAKDNVKFLYTLEKFSEPLYNSDPPGMLDSIPGLINSIRLINSISRYYNTSEKMTALFVKITNQMITACKAYLTNDGIDTIWTQPTAQLLTKITQCLKLNEEYQRCFHRTKAMLEEMPDERKFDFSEMYIFGKFDTFCRRLRKVVDMFHTIEIYGRMADAKIEGLDQLITKAQVVVTTMKKKQYDYLDQRRTDIDADFDEFKRQIADLHAGISTFIDQATTRIANTHRALTMLRKFESLKIPQLFLDEKYTKVLQHYGHDLEVITKLYHKQKNDPQIARDTPIIAGRIMWSRQLYMRITEPIEVFERVPNLLTSPSSRKIVKTYNKLAKVLLEFEMLYYRAWCRQVDVVKQGLLSSLLVRNGETSDLMVNFDPQILSLIREAELLSRLGLEIPSSALAMLQKQTELKHTHDRLVALLDDIRAFYGRIPPEYIALMEPHLNRLNAALEPGIININWTSVNIDQFIDKVYKTLNELCLLVSRAKDLREFRIDRVLVEMQETMLCEMPTDDDPWGTDDFQLSTTHLCIVGCNSLQQKSMNVEEAVNELINMLCGEPPAETSAEEEEAAEEGEDGENQQDEDGGEEKHDEESGEKRLSTRRSSERPKSQYAQGDVERRKETLAERKQRETKERIESAAMELLNHFNFRNVDAIVKVTRNTLETLRKRISMVKRYGVAQPKVSPFFKTNVELIIPSVVMQPTVEEVQQALTRSANMIVSVSKGISQWSKQRKRVGVIVLLQMPAAGVQDDDKKRREEKSGLEDGEQTEGEAEKRAGSAISPAPSEAEHSQQARSRRGRELTEDTHKQAVDQIAVQPKNYFRNISDNKEIAKLVSLLSSAISSNKKDVLTALEQFARYSAVWDKDRDADLEEFTKQEPKVGEFEAVIVSYEHMEQEVAREPVRVDVGPIGMYTEKFRTSLLVETKQWRLHYGKACNQKYRGEMESIFAFIDDLEKRLSRPIKDLDDIRVAMAALKEIRDNEIRIDMTLGPVEESYAMLNKHELPVAREETERVDTLRYTWQKLIAHAAQVQDVLLNVQPNFRGELLDNVQLFKQECDSFYSYYSKAGPNVAGIAPREASDALVICQNTFDNLFRKYVTYSGGEELFGMPVTEYPELMQIKKELALLQKLYGLYNDVLDTVGRYYEIPWTDVNIEQINSQLNDFQNRCRKLPKGLKEYKAYDDLVKKLNDFLEMVPLLELMTNKAMQKRHWQRISDTMNYPLDIESEGFTLRNVLEAPLLKYKEELEDICISAGKEKDIEAKLKTVMNDWNNKTLAFGNFKTRGELLLRGDTTQEIISAMEDSLMVLSSLLSNRYNAPFKKQIQQWTQNLTNTSEIIEQWMIVQNLWVYLEAVFVGGDIAKQLPKEAKRFQGIDKSWIKIMTRAHDITNVVQCCVGDDTLRQLLPHLQEQLELCQKSLTGYLEKKRLLFPRFFFVSDPALLEILGQASDPHTIQNHLLSIFDNIKSVKFHEKQYEAILTVISSEGEQVELEKSVRAEGNVEVWLMALMQMAHRSLHGVIRQAAMAIQDPSFNLLEFLNMFPAQIGLLGIQLIWTRDATDALTNAKSDRKIMQQTNQSFLDLLNLLINQTTRDLTPVERTKFETLITIHVHQRDIFDDMCKLHIKTPTDFEWLKQTRFYFVEDTDTMLISITDADFEYQNEFLGCTERLVITPLTDRCYITIAQALLMSMGAAPAGPAGTGKTETVKDMGRCLGKYVVVFNCSDQMDFRGLGRIFKGLAQSGSWGCFDEFNRIELPVLSVAAQQISTVLQCRKERKKQFIFTDGDNVDMNPEFGLFLTMNPGYAGRQELPENLKINFRSVAMIVPDRQVIIRVKLASVGFIENIILSKKFYTLYKLCEEQLTKQVHYDFGLRNILSVLRTLGTVKRANPNDSEQTTVMRVLRDMNLSKLVDQDEPLFLSLINDLFPGITLEKAGYPELEAAISKQLEDAKLINHPDWFLKVIQLFETQRVRHGMMALGPSGAGKTICIHTLMKAMTDCGEPHREWRMNPKAITASQMFGRLDVATNDWTDGIFSALWRRTLRVKKAEHIWIVLDGPVDAIWIENLNSVLDDTKKLTLANGDRIPMAPNCKLVFEPHNVDNASPATVSRNGMVFMSSSALNWNPILRGWLKRTYNMSDGELIASCFERSFEQINTFATQNLISKMEVLEAFIIRQCCDLLQGLIPRRESERESFISREHVERLYVFTLMWSIGALLELDDRAKFESFLRNHDSIKLDLPAVGEGSDATMFDYYVDEEGKWQHWQKRVSEYLYPPDSTPEYSSILVPNVDNVRTEFLIQTIAKQEKAVLLIGEPGSAKTVMIQGYMSKYNPEAHMSKTLNFSSATTPNLFQRTIESYVDKRVGTTYGPPAGRKMTIFIDDINMPNINEWGDQIANEIVRQLMEMKGFYSLEKPGDFTTIVDIQFVAAMIHPGGGRNDIPQRLKRQFNIFNCTLPSNSSIDKVFSVIGCGHFNERRGFRDEVRSMVARLVPLTRRLWQLTKVKMLPTPAKFHYIFNLRDLSRIWQGMLLAQSSVMTDSKVLLSLWKHECCRVIADRFVNDDDIKWFEKTMKRILSEDMGDEVGNVVDHSAWFVDFLRDAPEATGEETDDSELEMPKVYEPIASFEQLDERLHFFEAQYNETIRGSGLDLVFFKDAMTHLVKISRIIRTPKGHALLVGVGGSGKQSVTKLASFIAGYRSFQVTLTRAYNVNNFVEDLKFLYRTAGGQGKGISFIFTDQDIKDEGFLEYMNNVLASGVVSGLFPRDEMDEMLNELIGSMKKEWPRKPPSNENLYEYFMYRIRQNLHVVLCFSPVGEKFRNRSLKFPGLISGCTMDWFQRWPKEALVAVADHYLREFPIECTAEVKKQVIQLMGNIHDGVAESCVDYFQRFRRQAHVTPKSYLSFLNGYKNIYEDRYKQVKGQNDRMVTGLSKLDEAQVTVEELSKELAVKEKELAVANEKAEAVLKEVTAKAQAAEKVKAQVQKVKDKAQAIVDSIATDKAIAEEKLEKARPALEEAEAALNTIKPADIATVKKLGKPPHLIMRIMDCVLVLLRRRLDTVTVDPERPCSKPSWAESLKLMSGNLLGMLLDYPKDTINDEMVELLEPYLEMDDFNLETAKKVSGNVAGLLSWTRAMYSFFFVNKEVLPLKANLVVQEARLIAANRDLQTAQAQLDEKERELNLVKAEYEAAMAYKQRLQDEADACRRKMKAASALISGLGSEKIRWTEQSKEFQAQMGRLVGDVILATAFLSYSGPFNQEFRRLIDRNWQKELRNRKIPLSQNVNVIDMLTDPNTVAEWNLQGLPNDELSVQNGIIVTKAPRFPLLIDPQGQGKIWIKNRETKNELAMTSLNHKYFRQHMEDALSLGRPLLIEDVGEELDPALDNVLERNFIKQGSTLKVKVGDKEVDVMPGFRLFITTKLSNPRYTPEISARTSIIDFAVTMKGLEDQLLGRVVLTEKAELENERVRLMEEVTSNKRKIKELEDNLLYRLTNTEGSLVDDEELINVLNISKSTAADVSQKLQTAAETEVKINSAREEYRPVATRGSILYFLITEMSLVNAMYQTSLRQFLGLFDLGMARSMKSPIPQKRIQNIIEFMTFEVWKYAVRGLYEADKMTFTLLLALKIDMQQGKVKYEEFQTFVKGGASLDLNVVQPKPFRWVSDITWLNLVELSNLHQFSGILDQVGRNEKGWKQWFDKDAPEEEVIPDGYNTTLDVFRRLLLVRSWCPDRTLSQAKKYIGDSLGEKYAEGYILDIEKVWEESEPKSPMVGLLSMGSDPTPSIETLGKKHRMEVRAISMGQGQEVHARRLVQHSMQNGGWVLLQNCHLSMDYVMEVLDTILDAQQIHDDFRLWVTTEVHPKFPITFLQTSIKFSNEPPQGLKAGLKKTYSNFSPDYLDVSSMPQFKPMVYAVAFLHTTVQERRKFGPLGWNIPYEFNQADLNATLQFVQNHLDDMDIKKGVVWTCVRYMIGEIQYGGRVTDDFDKRLLNTYCKLWFQENMFAQQFLFYKNYPIPKFQKLQEFVDYINALPNTDTPEIFGLHGNADITYQSKTAKAILDCVLNIQPKDAAVGGGETRESIVYKLSDDMLSKLPPDYIPFEVRARLQAMGQLQPMNIFLRQEIDRIQRVLSAVRTTLVDLKLAIDGTIIMNENLRDALDCMFDARIPVSWQKISWDSSTLGFWFTELIERNGQFHNWLFNGRPNVFWMTGFFNPQGFLTAMRQEVTRAHKGWALDSVVLYNDVTKFTKDDVTHSPPEGVYVYGLFLDGCGFDRRGLKLIEPKPKQLFEQLPVIHIYAVNNVQLPDTSKMYVCPIYKKPRRTDLTYIASVYLKTSQMPEHWVLRGVALLCDVK